MTRVQGVTSTLYIHIVFVSALQKNNRYKKIFKKQSRDKKVSFQSYFEHVHCQRIVDDDGEIVPKFGGTNGDGWFTVASIGTRNGS